MPSEQVSIDFCCDGRTPGLARELALVIAPHLCPGTKAEVAAALAERVALLAERRLRDQAESPEPLRCHTCDDMTTIGNRVRVAVCNRCALEGRSPGCGG